jgi:flagellar FliL protein
MNIRRLRQAGCFCLLLMAPFTFANSGGGEVFAEGLNYLHIKPALVVNYGGVGKIKYIKAEVSLRVESNHAAVEATHHMPLIRDTLIMLFSAMTDEQLSSGEGKELMRQQALAKINQMLEQQIGAHHKAAGEKPAEHAKDEHAKDEHAKDEHAKDEHAKDEHGQAEHAKEEPLSLIHI